MKKIHIVIVIPLVLLALILGGTIGFTLGVASTKAGGRFLKSLIQDEEKANITAPITLKRAHFSLDHPRNWRIDKNDSDYDPDYMFSIDSPGNSYVMFIMGHAKTNPEQNIQQHLIAFEKLFEETKTERFSRYGNYCGTGVEMEGKMMGSQTKVRIFSAYEKGLSIIIIEQHPLADSAYVNEGLLLIEESFKLR